MTLPRKRQEVIAVPGGRDGAGCSRRCAGDDMKIRLGLFVAALVLPAMNANAAEDG